MRLFLENTEMSREELQSVCQFSPKGQGSGFDTAGQKGKALGQTSLSFLETNLTMV